jgi:hypothetical protein
MKKMMNILMLSCKKATELIEKKWVVKLSPIEKIQLTVHTSVCNACKTYEKQSEIIEKSIEQLQLQKNKSTQLPTEKKEQIIKQLEKK